jgi:plastocyanin
MRTAGLLLSVALGLLLICCGSSSGTAAPVATDRIDLPRSYRFAPEAITVPAGTTVTWTNSDVFTHTVRLLDDGGEVLTMRPGESVTHTFDTVGTRRYDCSLHPQNMTGSVVVTEAAPG